MYLFTHSTDRHCLAACGGWGGERRGDKMRSQSIWNSLCIGKAFICSFKDLLLWRGRWGFLESGGNTVKMVFLWSDNDRTNRWSGRNWGAMPGVGDGGGGELLLKWWVPCTAREGKLCASILILPDGARMGWGHPKAFTFNWLGLATGIGVVSPSSRRDYHV